MPINSVSEIKFGMMVDGKFTEIEPIPELPNDSSIDSNENLFFEGSSEIEIVGTYDKSIFPIRNHEQSVSFLITNNRNYRRFLRSIRRLFPVPSNKSNNWLRMHGYPMVRKSR